MADNDNTSVLQSDISQTSVPVTQDNASVTTPADSSVAAIAPIAPATEVDTKPVQNTFQYKLSKLKEAGVPDSELQAYTVRTGAKLSAAGVPQDQVNEYIGNKLPDMNGVQKMMQDNLSKAQETDENGEKKPLSLEQALDAGWGTSITGLFEHGRVSDQQLTGNEPWYTRAVSSTAQMAGDLPAMAAGYAIGGANPITGTAGAFALPTALRGILMDSYSKGEFNNFSEFMERALPIAIDIAKSYATGAATGGAGVVAASAGALAKIGVETATMTTVAAALNGKAPAKQDFIDNAIVMFGMHGITEGTKYLRGVYKDTGVSPAKVMEDAKTNPEIAEDVKNGVVPKAYQEVAQNATIKHPNEEFDKFVSEGNYSRDLQGSHQAAADYVLSKGSDTGHEYGVGVDAKTGEVSHIAYSSSKNIVIPTEDFTKELNNPDSDIIFHHNHPSNRPLSKEDISVMTSSQGLSRIIAHGAAGDISSADIAPKFKEQIQNKSDEQVYNTVRRAHQAAESPIRKYLQDLVNKKEITGAYASTLHAELINKVLHTAGIIDYKSSYDTKELMLKDSKSIDSAVKKVYDSLKNEGITNESLYRRTEPVLLKNGIGELYARNAEKSPNSTSEGSDAKSPSNIGKNEVDSDFGDNWVSPAKTPQSAEGASVSINPLNQILNPVNISESSRDMATALRQAKGSVTQSTAQFTDLLQKYIPLTTKLSEEQSNAFKDYVENAKENTKLPNQDLQPAADALREVYDKMYTQVKIRVPDLGYIQNYLMHQFTSDVDAKKFVTDWVAKQGSEKNLQERVIPTLKEAREYGLVEKEPNPIKAAINYVGNMNNLIAAYDGVKLAQEAGIADYFKKGQQPTGWVPLNGNLSERAGKTLYAPEDAARVYNNDISEKASGPAGNIIDNIQRANNFASKLVLGLSGYHFTATTLASMSSDVARAINSGSLRDRLSNVISAVTPLKSTLQGSQLVDAYLGRSELPPELQQAMDLAVKNNTINIKQQDYWKAGPAKDYVDSFKAGTLGEEAKNALQTIKQRPLVGTAKVIATEMGKTMDTISKPLFDYYIPRIKISANITELHDWIQKHPEATPQEMDRAAQDIGNSIDNRFGEMMRDNLFWHQLTRQTLQTGLLSYSWVTGGARLVKGIPDIGATILGKQELTSNAKYLLGMAITYVVVNGVRTYIGTGQAPNSIEDFIYPRTGGTTPQGKAEREILPSHIGQYTNYLHEGIGALGNEVNPGLKLLYHLTANEDFRGLPITNNNNSWFKEQRWDDYLKYVLHEETPIGLKNFIEGDKKGTKVSILEKLLGARQAPRFVTDPQGYGQMMESVNNKEYEKKTKSDIKAKAQFQ